MTRAAETDDAATTPVAEGDAVVGRDVRETPEDLRTILAEVFETLPAEVDPGRDLFPSVGDGPYLVPGPESVLREAVRGVILSVRDATPPGGRIVIRMEGVKCGAGSPMSGGREDALAGRWCLLSAVGSNGVGDSPDAPEAPERHRLASEGDRARQLQRIRRLARERGGDLLTGVEPPGRSASLRLYLPRVASETPGS